MKTMTLANVIAVAPGRLLDETKRGCTEWLTWVSPAEKVEEEAVIVYRSVRRDGEYLRAKHTGQGSIIRSSVLGHLAGVGEIRELISSSSSLTLDALSSGAIRLSARRLYFEYNVCLPIGKILSKLTVLYRV